MRCFPGPFFVAYYSRMRRPTLLTVTITSVAFASFIGGLHAQSLWFKDVPDDHWAKDAITYVADNGLMKGMNADTFAPNEPVTRAQLAMVLYRQSSNDTYVPDPYVPPEIPEAKPATIDDDTILGTSTAKITLIEFGDYQCPFCKRHYDNTLSLIKEHYIDTGKVRFVFRDLPLSFHVNAYAAAEASECADEQDAFWGMHDLLYGQQKEWMDESDPTDAFMTFAGILKLNTTDFRRCLDSDDMQDEIDDDADDASASGVNGTPGFWILGPNGQTKQISGAHPYETFEAAFDDMLN